MALNFHKKHLPQATNMIEKSRYSIQAGTLNENDYRTLMTSINTSCNEPHDPNRNLFHNIEENVPDRKNSVVYRERYQYPALVSVIGEARTRKFRGKIDLSLFSYQISLNERQNQHGRKALFNSKLVYLWYKYIVPPNCQAFSSSIRSFQIVLPLF